MNQITDTSGDKPPVRCIYIVIYAFKHKKGVTGYVTCINKQRKTSFGLAGRLLCEAEESNSIKYQQEEEFAE